MRLAPILLGALLALLPSLSFADATEPSKDLPGSSDPAWLKRFEGSFIISYEHRTFDAIDFPASKLVVDTSERRDSMNNQLAIAPRTVHAEGEYTRLLYLAPAQASPLEVIRNYINEIKANGGRLMYGCRDEGCGGSIEGNTHGGGVRDPLIVSWPAGIRDVGTTRRQFVHVTDIVPSVLERPPSSELPISAPAPAPMIRPVVPSLRRQ